MTTRNVLLSRDEFREGVFKRDGHKCVFCDKPAVDAHHILERRLFQGPDEIGGYFMNNGASVCEEHHLACEMTTISVQEVRDACGITKPVIPSHLYEDHEYDKWGNIVLPNGTRLKGELFNDESVQKVLAKGGVLDLFTHWVKYPRTHHVPWSEGLNPDDRMLPNMSHFEGRRVIVTEKMDGENTTMYQDYIHARSLDGRNHASRNWVKNFWGQICGDIPLGWRVCGENLFAKHSIAYDQLPTYFMGFSMWNDRNECLSWDETLEYFNLMGITPVPVLYDGIYDETAIKALYNPKTDWQTREGYVIRVADGFAYGQFRTSVAKFVRKNHVQTVKHWMHGQAIEQNGLMNV
jgi:hypothetical protein